VGDPAGLLRARRVASTVGDGGLDGSGGGRYQRAVPEPRAGAEAAGTSGVDMHAALLSAGPVDVPTVGVRIQGRALHHDVGMAVGHSPTMDLDSELLGRYGGALPDCPGGPVSTARLTHTPGSRRVEARRQVLCR
jgi:hypothetical protein